VPSATSSDPGCREVIIRSKLRTIALGVEYVMGFFPRRRTNDFGACPQIEKYILDGRHILIKIWLEVGKEEQQRRFSRSNEDSAFGHGK